MPQRSIYIREEDDEKWQALPNKSEFIHNALNPSEYVVPKNYTGGLQVSPQGKRELRKFDESLKPIKTPEDARKAVEPLTGHKTYFKKGKK